MKVAAVALIIVVALVLLALLWAGRFDHQLQGWFTS